MFTSTMKGAAVALAVATAACGDGHGGGDVGTISAPQGRLWGARFAPDGTHLSVAYGESDKIGVLDLDSLTLRELAEGGSYLTGTAWTTNGDTIYYNGADGVFSIASEVGLPVMVNDGFATTGIDVAADGRKLAYGVNGGNARIYTIATRMETALARRCQAIRFAPSGTAVACISDGALLVIDIATGAETPIVAFDVPFIAGVDWYPDGQQLLYTSSRGIERVTLAGETTLIHSSFAAIDVDLAPDESAIVFGVNGQPALTLLQL